MPLICVLKERWCVTVLDHFIMSRLKGTSYTGRFWEIGQRDILLESWERCTKEMEQLAIVLLIYLLYFLLLKDLLLSSLWLSILT